MHVQRHRRQRRHASHLVRRHEGRVAAHMHGRAPEVPEALEAARELSCEGDTRGDRHRAPEAAREPLCEATRGAARLVAVRKGTCRREGACL